MALVSDIQLQPSAVKPPNLDTGKKFSAEGLTATTAFAVTDAGAGTTVSTSGLITAKSSNDVRNWFQSTKADGNVELYMSNDARPDWALRVSGTADNAFIIANSYGSNCTAQFPAFSIGGAGAVGIGKTGATNALDIAYKNSTTGGIQITETQNNVGVKVIAESAAGFIGTSSNHKLGFRVNNSTVGLFNTSGQFGIGTDSPGATLDVRGGAIFNEAGAAVDFRIEGDAEQNLFFVDGSADAIGMGTATPVDTSRLHVMGTDGDAAANHSGEAMLIVENCGTTFLELATGNANHAGLTFSDAAAATRGGVLYDHGTGLGGAADSLYFQTAGSIRAVLQSDGDFGIGTLAPGGDLHLAGVDDPEIRIEGASDGDPQINFYQGSSTCRATIAYQDTNDVFAIDSAGTLQLQTASSTKLTIGNCVGIGTTAPVDACNAQLDIFSTAATTAIMLRTGNTSAASATIRGEGYRGDGDSEQVLQVVGRNSNNSIDLGIFEVAAESKHCLGALELKTFDGSSMSTKMKISSGGCVGIGTSAPTDIFHVRLGSNLNWKFGYPNNSVTTLAALNDAESAYVTARIDALTLELNGQSGGDVNLGDGIIYVDTGSDLVGINTSTPQSELEISSTDARTTLTLDNRSSFSAGSTRTSISFESINDTDARSQYAAINAITTAGSYGGGELAFVTRRPGDGSNAESMRIDDAGQLGIGTATPGDTLDVRGGAIAVYGQNTTHVACAIKIGHEGSGLSQIRAYGVNATTMGSLEFTVSASDGSPSCDVMTISDYGVCVGAPNLKISTDGVVSWGDNVDNGVLTWDTGKAIVGGQSSHVLQLNAKGAARATVDDGFFGIGTASNSGFGGACQQVIINGAANARLEFGIGGSQLGGLFSTADYVALYTSGNDYLSFQTCGTERVRILADGNVGIGTTAPADNLHIQADQPGIRFTDTAGSSDILVDAAGSCYGIYMRADGSNTNLFLQSGSDNRVGISTTAPCCTAHVYGELMVGKGQGVNANALIALNSTTAAGCGSILQGTTNNGIDWQVGHYKAILGSGSDTALKLQGFNGVSIGACATGSGSTENMYFNANGRIGIGTRDRGNVFFESGHSAMMLIEGTTPGNSSLGLLRNNTQYGPTLILARSCGSSVGSNTLVAANQTIGGINWQANDGTDFIQAATIAAKIGNHAAANCMSGELQFYTTDGSNGSLLERMRIHEDGRIAMGTTATCIARLTALTSAAGDYALMGITTLCDRGVLFMCNTNNQFNDIMFVATSARNASTGYDFTRFNANDGIVFRVQGNGATQGDGAYTSPAGDYSEFFESTTGIASERGRAVVLDGDKIRYYNSATDELDSIIGVTRPKEEGNTTGFIGNNAWSHWHGKYLTDDWGVYIYETTTVWTWSVETETGSETCNAYESEIHTAYEKDELAKDPNWTPPAGAVSSSQSVRKLNPSYDESLDNGYQARDSRDEWWLIGLLGQVPVKAGEPVNPRWIKMKDISAAVEYYYIR